MSLSGKKSNKIIYIAAAIDGYIVTYHKIHHIYPTNDRCLLDNNNVANIYTVGL